ncbi:MAG: PD-(D/E)XK nuclease family protein [Gemmatimonadota bacterium]|jgi:ATP-dependent helicase/nuclease subunit B
MARLNVVLSHRPAALLDAAADAFLSPPPPDPGRPFLSPPYLLVLRESALRDDLFARAAELGVRGWFDPPLCVFRQLPDWLGATERVPCGDYERLVLAGQCMRRAAGDVFGRVDRPDAFMDAVDRLFGELAAEGVTADALARAMAARTDRDGFERRRDDELAAAYRLYLETLAASGKRDGRDWLVDAAEAAADAGRLAARLGGRREIRLLGLQDLKGGWPILLRTLATSDALDRVAVYTSVPLELPGIDVQAEWLDDGHRLAARLFTSGDAAAQDAARPAGEQPGEPGDAATLASGSPDDRVAGLPLFDTTEVVRSRSEDDPPGRAPRVRIISAPDTEREVEEVACRVRTLIDGGVPAQRIAVVARHNRPFIDLAIDALARVGVPATARRRLALAEIPVVRSILTLFRVAAEGWTRYGLVELAEQPYLGVRLNVRVLNHIGYRRRIEGLPAWDAAIEALYQEAVEWERRLAESADDEEDTAMERRSAPPAAEQVAAALDDFRDFAMLAGVLDGDRRLDAWLDWLASFVEDDPWSVERRVYDVPADRLDAVAADAAAWMGVREIVRQWREAVKAWGGGEERLATAAFEARLREMLSGDAALWTRTQRGVQVLEALAALQRSFDDVFVVGLEGGRFPSVAPRSPILDERDREALVAGGLPMELREVWEAREREAFRSLVAGARTSLTLSHARLDERGGEVVASTFIDEVQAATGVEPEEIGAWRVLTPHVPVVSEGAVDAALHGARIERLRQTGASSAYNGLIEDAELQAWLAVELGEGRIWSPTQLESYAKCPWAYFSGRLLRLDKKEDPDADIDPRVRGTVLHDALRRFYQAAVERAGGPVLLRDIDLAWARPAAVKALDAALDQAGQVWLGHPALRGARRQELQKLLLDYLAFEVQANEDMFSTRKRNAPRILRTGVTDHELKFDDVVLEVAGVRVRFRGIVDRVERGVDERVDAAGFVAAVDYKSSKGSVPGAGDRKAWDDDVVLQVPLYAYALTRLQPGDRVARVEYRSIRQPAVLHSLQLAQVNPKTETLEEDDDAAAHMTRALDSVGRHVRTARGGQFPARPAPSCMCPPFCHAWDICRVAGGPRTKRNH